MTLLGKEHYDLMDAFERENRGLRLDREKDKAEWARGHIYESGETNNLFLAYRSGYALGVSASSPDETKEEILKAASARVVKHLEAWEVHNVFLQGIKDNLIHMLPAIIESEEA